MNTILLVDDHVLFREGLFSLMQRWDDFDVVGEASTGEQAVSMCRDLLPDLVLMDVAMPVMNGLEATRQITRELPTTRVVMLTVSEDDESLFEAIKSGAAGYILKDAPSRRLHDQLRGVMRGESPLSGAVATKMLIEFNRQSEKQAAPDVDEPLTEREQQVLKLVSEGMSNQEIAEALYLSENTVKKHIRNILQKLHLNNRVQAAVFAAREGMISKE
jgi:RNA polymerase sigma factor (sigma-70 family)